MEQPRAPFAFLVILEPRKVLVDVMRECTHFIWGKEEAVAFCNGERVKGAVVSVDITKINPTIDSDYDNVITII